MIYINFKVDVWVTAIELPNKSYFVLFLFFFLHAHVLQQLYSLSPHNTKAHIWLKTKLYLAVLFNKVNIPPNNSLEKATATLAIWTQRTPI